MFARVALAGALVVTPLAAVAATASADPGAGPAVTEVRHPHGNDWKCRNDNWRDRHDDWWDLRNENWWDDDCDGWNNRNHDHDRDNNGWRNSLPRGWFGSS